VDRGSGKAINASVRAAHTRLSPAEIAGARDSLEELELAGRDEAHGPLLLDGPPSTAGMSLETISLLAQAQRVIAANPDNAAVARAVADVEAAARRADPAGLEAASETLLDLLYDLDDDS
jgi:molecular chaperone DnaK